MEMDHQKIFSPTKLMLITSNNYPECQYWCHKPSSTHSGELSTSCKQLLKEAESMHTPLLVSLLWRP